MVDIPKPFNEVETPGVKVNVLTISKWINLILARRLLSYLSMDISLFFPGTVYHSYVYFVVIIFVVNFC